MIELKNIFKYYSNGFLKAYVLQDLSLKIEEGEFVTIMGPSGSGKSTLLHILGMLDNANSGDYLFMEQQVLKLNERKRSEIHKYHMGFVFQAYHLIDELTVYENIETPLLYKKVKGKERQSRVCDILDRFNIVGKKDLFPHQLSGGQQQLVGIARAIITSPRLLLADEPTGNLNSTQGEEIMSIFKRLHEEGTTIVQVTHSEKNASYGNRIIHLLDGRVQGEETVEKMHA